MRLVHQHPYSPCKIAREPIVDLDSGAVVAKEILCREDPFPDDAVAWRSFYRRLFSSDPEPLDGVVSAFNHAKARGDFFEGVAVGQLEFGLLKQVRSMVEGYEVAACPSWQWERAILQGFEIFRQLREHKHGVVRVDMLAHLLEFSPRQITGSDI